MGNYAFNTWCEAVFNCYPDGDYFSRPGKISGLQITENETHNGVTLSWTNPAVNYQGDSLTAMDSIVILRDFHVIAKLGNMTPSEPVQFTDPATLSEGKYEYAVYAVNGTGNGIPVHESVLLGTKCNLFIEMHDSGENGWYGGSISILKDGARIGVVTLEDGAHDTLMLPMLKGDLDFFWNKGWGKGVFDNEISFTIYNSDHGEIFSSPDSLTSGHLFSYALDCADAIDEYKNSDNDNSAQVFPNPADHTLSVHAEGLQQIRVYNLMREMLHHVICTSDTTTLNTSAFDAGLYIVQVETTKNITNRRIAIVH